MFGGLCVVVMRTASLVIGTQKHFGSSCSGGGKSEGGKSIPMSMVTLPSNAFYTLPSASVSGGTDDWKVSTSHLPFVVVKVHLKTRKLGAKGF